MTTNTRPRSATWAGTEPAAGSVNWGRKARKKTATFGFRALTTNPWRNRRRVDTDGRTSARTVADPRRA
jgi:hypothetical protein